MKEYDFVFEYEIVHDKQLHYNLLSAVTSLHRFLQYVVHLPRIGIYINHANTGFCSSSQAQTSEDIALVIKEAILSDKPHLHYPTSDSMKAVASMKYKDPTGDSVVQMIAGRNKQHLQS